jgi:Protein of unknown function (DUF4230)
MQRPVPSRVSVVVGFLLGFIVASLMAAVVILLFRRGGPPRIDTSRPTVIRQIQQLQRLDTVVFNMDKIVSGGWESRYLPTFLAGERLLLVVGGEATAGVDLGRIAAANIIVSGQTIRMKIPDAEIFATRVDNERTRVYSRDTGLFTRVDPNLESDVRREAERQIRQAALDNGILRVAAANARTTLTSFLRGLGFEQPEFW